MIATERPAAPMPPSRYLSVIFSPMPANQARGLNFAVPLPLVRRRLLPPPPGRRLISIMVCMSPGLVLAQREADRQHEERGDLVSHQRLQRSRAHRHGGKRVGELDRLLQPLSE